MESLEVKVEEHMLTLKARTFYADRKVQKSFGRDLLAF